jgi:hypothetical protein
MHGEYEVKFLLGFARTYIAAILDQHLLPCLPLIQMVTFLTSRQRRIAEHFKGMNWIKKNPLILWKKNKYKMHRRV